MTDEPPQNKSRVKCRKCGKPIALDRRPGSLTSYLFAVFECSCSGTGISADAAAGDVRPGTKGSDTGFCPRCGLQIETGKREGSLTGFLFQGTRCKCIKDKALGDGEMSARFWKLRQAGAGTTFNTGSGDRRKRIATIDLLPGAIIGGVYEIIRQLGVGGMGEVYLARHVTLNNRCALKVIPPEQVTENTWLRFQREAQVVARLEHINLVRVTDLGIHEGCLPYFAMDYVEGKNLAQILAEDGPMPLDMVLEVFAQVCSGVKCAHLSGILHRDLKPANIMVSRTSKGAVLAKILDFGLVKPTGHDRSTQSLTTLGDIFGSPFYMSPEQCAGEKLDNRSDIYSLGCSMFECLTGRPPFEGSVASVILDKQMRDDAPSLEKVAGRGVFPDGMEIIIAKMLRKNPAERYETIDQLRSDLLKVQKGESVLPVYMSRSQPYGRVKDGRRAGEEEGYQTDTNRGSYINWIGVAAAGLILVAAALWFIGKSLIKPPKNEPVTLAVSDIAHKPIAEQPSRTSDRKLDGAPYLLNPGATQRGYLTYFFPTDVCLGELYLVSDNAAGGAHSGEHLARATGMVLLPPHERLELVADEPVWRDPQLLEGFSPNDLYVLALKNQFEWGDKHISYISRLTGLRVLEIHECSVTNKCLESIDKLPMLQRLLLESSEISGKALAGLKRLPDFNYLEVGRITDVHSLIEKLAGSRNIRGLSLCETNLTDADLKIIASSPQVVALDLNYNRFITIKGLEALYALKKIKYLALFGVALSSDCIDVLKRLNPEILKIDTRAWSEQDNNKLKLALPKCQIINKGTSATDFLNP